MPLHTRPRQTLQLFRNNHLDRVRNSSTLHRVEWLQAQSQPMERFDVSGFDE
jgi:hypothetical protein